MSESTVWFQGLLSLWRVNAQPPVSNVLFYFNFFVSCQFLLFYLVNANSYGFLCVKVILWNFFT